ncbi:MAG TPA: hypothetical protein VHY91_00685 [Pirellulales bacterium]|jgi:hypothetical protein|nr:hypothetical protein [Pirellulales bacterium]
MAVRIFERLWDEHDTHVGMQATSTVSLFYETWQKAGAQNRT